MSRLYMRLIVTMLLVVAGSAFIANTLIFLLWDIFSFEGNIDLAMRIRLFFAPVFTIISSAIVIPVTSKKAAAPIVELSAIAKKIAKGDFDISIKKSKRKDEIGDLERDFGLMIKELNSNEFMRKDFIANISHEFKTPLSIIQGYSKLLAKDLISDEERKQCALTIKNESERLLALSSNILRLSRLNAQTIQTNRTSFRIDEQIRQAVLLLEPTWSRRSIKFDIALYDQYYFGDEELLSQVWLNVIENAVKFSHNKGVIHIRLKNMESSIQVEIADHGRGIDETTKSRVFEQFYQGEASRANDGSGLGLAIVKRIVELHKGSINIESIQGEGTKFFVILPLVGEN